MKLRALNEKTARSGWSEVLVKRYSSAPAGSDEPSASGGVKGLQPVSSTASGTAGSHSETVPKGKRAENEHERKRGKP
jgi:hypothetical protein